MTHTELLIAVVIHLAELWGAYLLLAACFMSTAFYASHSQPYMLTVEKYRKTVR